MNQLKISERVQTAAKTQDFKQWLSSSSLFQDSDGDTIFHVATVHKSKTFRDILIRMVSEKSCDLNVSNKAMQTPLHLACITDQPKLVEAFLESGKASVLTTDRNGDTSVHLSVKHATEETLRVVLEYTRKENFVNTVIDKRNLEGFSALHLAAFYDKTEQIRLLLEFSASIDIQEPRSGKSPLYVAVQERNKDSAQLLLTAGADPNLQTSFRDSPSQLASNIDDRTLFRLFSRYSSSRSRSQSPSQATNDETEYEVKEGDIDRCDTGTLSHNTVKKELELRNNNSHSSTTTVIPVLSISNKTHSKGFVKSELTIGESSNDKLEDDMNVLKPITQGDLDEGYYKQLNSKNNSPHSTDQPLDLSISSSKMRTPAMKEKNVACETRLNQLSTYRTENETSRNSHVDFISKKKKVTKEFEVVQENKKLQSRNVAESVTRMSVKKEGIDSEDTADKTGAFLKDNQEETNTSVAISNVNNYLMSTLYQQTAGHQPGVSSHGNLHAIVPGYGSNPANVAFLAPSALPFDYYSPGLNSAILKNGIAGVPLTWANLALVQAMKTLQYETKAKEIEATDTQQQHVDAMPRGVDSCNSAVGTSNTDTEARNEVRTKLQCSLSDGTNDSTSSNHHKTFERRNSAPTSSPLLNNTSQSQPPPSDLHSYTGCLPPHLLHLLHSSGNLVNVQSENAFVNGLYIDPRRVQHDLSLRKDKAVVENGDTKTELGKGGNAEHGGQSTMRAQSQSKRPSAYPDRIANTSLNDIAEAKNYKIVSRTRVITSMRDNIDISSSKNDHGHETKFDSVDDDSDDEIQISDDELEDDFEHILIKTAKEQSSINSRKMFLQNHANAQRAKQSWRYIDTLPVFKYHNVPLDVTRSASTDRFLPHTKSGYHVQPSFSRQIPCINKYLKISRNESIKVKPDFDVHPYCHHSQDFRHSCLGCTRATQKSTKYDSEKLLQDIIRAPVIQKSYSSPKSEPRMVFCADLAKQLPKKNPSTEQENDERKTFSSSMGNGDIPTSYFHKLFNATSRSKRFSKTKTISSADKEKHSAENDKLERVKSTRSENFSSATESQATTTETANISEKIMSNPRTVTNSDGNVQVKNNLESRKRSPPPAYSPSSVPNKRQKPLHPTASQPHSNNYAPTINSSNLQRYTYPSAIGFQDAAYYPVHPGLHISPFLINGIKLNSKLAQVHAAAIRNYQNSLKSMTDDEKLEITDLEISDDES